MRYQEDKSFAAELDKFEDEEVKGGIVRLHKLVSQFVLLTVVTKTPVDTGNTRKSWLVDINNFYPSDSESELSVELKKINKLKAFDVLYIHNSAEPIIILEEGLFVPPDPGPSKDPRPGRHGKILVKGGFSTQAPQGMLGITLEEAKELFK